MANLGSVLDLSIKKTMTLIMTPYTRVIVQEKNTLIYPTVKYNLNELKLNQKLYKKHSTRRKRTKRTQRPKRRTKRVRRRPQKLAIKNGRYRKVLKNGPRYQRIRDEPVSLNGTLLKGAKVAFISKPMDLKKFVKILKSAHK